MKWSELPKEYQDLEIPNRAYKVGYNVFTDFDDLIYKLK